eukprot:NODE_11728_length_1268_cov_7.055215.p1 GENE.NODE_11728_length_1268_cov_7.055215~~NODE_11728_length_1268_cov_7.055215.p1  ORF type:complete len:333 (-),score=98.68 NODE_11728_length_1268_cov_7.055215:157-1155(-)
MPPRRLFESAMLRPAAACPKPETGNGDAVPYRSPAHIVRARGPDGPVRLEPLPVEYGGFIYKSEVAYPSGDRRRPIVLVFPNYAGKKAFDVDQATFLAMCGYTAVAVEERDASVDDGYNRDPPKGCGIEAYSLHRTSAFHAMNSLRADVGKMREIARATLAAARAFGGHETKAAAIGYCFGGQYALECVRGGVDLDCIVTFHGLLQTYPTSGGALNTRYPIVKPPANTYTKRCRILIENGDLDQEVPQVAIDAFRAEMDAAGLAWRLDTHGQVKHGFALPPTLISGDRFHEAADRHSTLSMLALFTELWPEFPPVLVARNAAGTQLCQASKL